MSATPNLTRQRAAAAVLPDLIAIPAPPMWSWEIRYDGTIEGSNCGWTVDETRAGFEAWAEHLDNPKQSTRTRSTDDRLDVELTGRFEGVDVRLWNLLDVTADEFTALAEVSAR